jgi:Tol biopolymer transport system component
VGVSPAGILAYQTGLESGQLTWFDRSGRPVDALPVDASDTSPQISPDGSVVAMRKFGASGEISIWVTDLARTSSSPVTFGRNDVSPAWSRTGRRLAFLRIIGKDAGVHIVAVTDASKDQFLQGTVDDAPTNDPLCAGRKPEADRRSLRQSDSAPVSLSRIASLQMEEVLHRAPESLAESVR